MLDKLIGFIPGAVAMGIPLLYGCTGEIITEKSGNLNMGIPGIMYIGSICGVIGSFRYEQSLSDKAAINPVLAILIPLTWCLVGSGLMGLLYCFLTVTLRANQNVTGLAMTTFGTGLGNFFGGSLIHLSGSNSSETYISVKATSDIFRTTLPFADKCGWFGKLFLSYGFLTYLAIIIAVVAAYFLKRTRKGLQLRAVGENAATADAVGINVTLYKYTATTVGAMIAGLGGLFYIMDYIGGSWSNNAFGDRGWLAVALVIFVVWKPNLAIFGALLFGTLYNLPVYVEGLTLAQKKLFEMIPYVATLVVLVFSSIRNRRENQPPAGLGLNYYREER